MVQPGPKITHVCAVQSATDELERLEQAFNEVKKHLLGRLHHLARKQIGFHPTSDAGPKPLQLPEHSGQAAEEPPSAAAQLLHGNGIAANGTNGGISLWDQASEGELGDRTFKTLE